MIKYLHNMGLRSEHAYAAGFGSIALTVINWAGSKLMHSGDKADRNGLFTGQWADLTLEEVAELAAGWGASWLSGRATDAAFAQAHLGVAAHERVAGLIHIGTRGETAVPDRPRPDVAARTSFL